MSAAGLALPPPQVGIVMGSDSDWPVMSEAKKALDEMGIGTPSRERVLNLMWSATRE